MEQAAVTAPSPFRVRLGLLTRFGGACMGFVGLILTFTGLGALLGIPMMLVGLALVFRRPRLAGACPHCGTSMDVKFADGFDCPACAKRVIVKDGAFFPVS